MSEKSMGKILSFAISVNKKMTVKINVIVFFFKSHTGQNGL